MRTTVDDTITVSDQVASVIGGLGTDTLIVNGATGITINLNTAGIEVFHGGDGSAVAGNLTINGNAGADTLLGLAGTDFLIGGTGGDLVRYTATGDSVVGVGRDIISGFDAVGAGVQDRVDASAIDANTAVAGN